MGETVVATTLSTKTRSILVIALALALLANLSGILTNSVRGQKTCKEVESLKAPEYELAKENLKNLSQYKGDYIRIFGSKPRVDPRTGETVPRWRIEYDRAVRIQTERVYRFRPHSCPFLFWSE